MEAKAIYRFVMFGFNYYPGFINKVWENEPYLAKHLSEKFSYYYSKYGPEAVMNTFFVNLDPRNQEKLVKWIDQNYNA